MLELHKLYNFSVLCLPKLRKVYILVIIIIIIIDFKEALCFIQERKFLNPLLF